MLPNSSYLFKFTKEMGTNIGDSANFEYKTPPDSIIENSYFNAIFIDDECVKKLLNLKN